jgi:hypothetical protein
MQDRLSFARRLLDSQAVWILIFIVLILLTRAQSLRTEVIDWDESTFIVMASQSLQGHLPYLHVWEVKPPMLFFALAHSWGFLGRTWSRCAHLAPRAC